MLAFKALELSQIDFAITEGLRTRTRQLQLFSDGKSQTINSRHVTGHALDFVAYIDGEVTWDFKHYKTISEAFKAASELLNIPVEWGGDWKTLKDGPHIQLPRGIYS